MKQPLYLLRQPVDHIPSGVFDLSETEGDIVLLEEARSHQPAASKARTFFSVGSDTVSQVGILTYEELVEKIFSTDSVLVI